MQRKLKFWDHEGKYFIAICLNSRVYLVRPKKGLFDLIVFVIQNIMFIVRDISITVWM